MKRLVSLAISVAVAGGVARGETPTFPKDIIVIQRVTSDHGTVRKELLASKNLLKIRETSDKGGQESVKETLIDFAARKIVDLNVKARQYTESGFDELEKKFRDSFEGFRKLPAEEQARLRARATGLPPTKIERTEEFATVAGFKARRYDVTIIDQRQELWASPSFVFPPAYYDVLELRNPVLGPAGQAVRDRLRQLRQIEGFVLKQVVHGGRPENPVTTTTETLEVRQDVKIPAAEFEIPKGFSKPVPRGTAGPAPITATPASLSFRTR